MATWIQGTKTFLKLIIPADIEPTNALLLEIGQALVTHRESWWREFIGKLDSIHPTLPNGMQKPGGEAWEIGTIDPVTGEYDADFSANDNNAAIAGFVRWAYRTKEVLPALKSFRKDRQDLGAPAATETPAEALARREAEARAAAVGDIGDDGDEVPDA